MPKSFQVVKAVCITGLCLLGACQPSLGSDKAEAPIGSQQIIRPGDQRLELSDVLAPSSTVLDLAMERDGALRSLGTMRDVLYNTHDGDLVRVQTLAMNGNAQIDVTTAASTLVPRRHYSQNARRTVDLTYADDRVTGTYGVVGEEGVKIADTWNGTSFDSNHIDLIARAIPLEADFEQEVATYERAAASSAQTDVIYNVRFVGTETINGDDVAITAFRRGSDEAETLLYINPQDRSVIRMVSETAPGMTMIMSPQQ